MALQMHYADSEAVDACEDAILYRSRLAGDDDTGTDADYVWDVVVRDAETRIILECSCREAAESIFVAIATAKIARAWSKGD